MSCPLTWWTKYQRSCLSKLIWFPAYLFINFLTSSCTHSGANAFIVLFITSITLFFLFNPPREPQGIIACCNPVPPLVRQQVNELHLLVQEAREMPLLKVRFFFPLVVSYYCLCCHVWNSVIYILTQAEIAAQQKKGVTPIKKVEVSKCDLKKMHFQLYIWVK